MPLVVFALPLSRASAPRLLAWRPAAHHHRLHLQTSRRRRRSGVGGPSPVFLLGHTSSGRSLLFFGTRRTSRRGGWRRALSEELVWADGLGTARCALLWAGLLLRGVVTRMTPSASRLRRLQQRFLVDDALDLVCYYTSSRCRNKPS